MHHLSSLQTQQDPISGLSQTASLCNVLTAFCIQFPLLLNGAPNGPAVRRHFGGALPGSRHIRGGR